MSEWLPESGSLLEIGAGTGQHAAYLSRRLPGWRWLPTEHPEQLATLRAGLDGVDRTGLREPVALDVAGQWPDECFDAVFSANTAHIMHWPMVVSMFEGVAGALRPGGRFLLYGPFMNEGRHTAPSNAAFDRQLRSRDPGMGVRDLTELTALAGRVGLAGVAVIPMPANNFVLVFDKPGTAGSRGRGPGHDKETMG
ncbi:MAG: DUF938 domain-containing protein [Wenzhouxiangellaceae bacterium]